MKLPEFSVDRPVSATMLTFIVVVVGFISFAGLGLDMFPDIEFPVVTVVTSYQGASPEDVESSLTKPIEQAVASVSGVKGVNSSSIEGASVVMVEFESGINLDFAAQDLRDQLAMLTDYLPENIRTPLVLKFDISQIPILFYGITSDIRSTKELTKIMEDNVAHRLERLDGVASVMVESTERSEILIEVDRSALETHAVTLNQMIQVLRFENLNLPAGRITEDHLEYLVRTKAEFASLQEIENLVVGMSQLGHPIQLRQVATVKDTIKETTSVARIQESSGVVMLISKQSGANVVQVADEAKRELEEIKAFLPADIQFHIAWDQSDSTKRMVKSTAMVAFLGGLLAMVLIYLFMRNIRPTLTIGVAVPISIIATFIPIRIAGYTLNLLTIGGLALGVGMLVDNAIVVIENMFRHLEEGKRRRDAAKIGASEVGMAITASTFTTLAVFIPLALGSGIAGQLSRGLALTISFAVLASLFVSLTIVPMIGSVFFKKHVRAEKYEQEFGEAWFARIKTGYTRLLSKSLRHRRRVLGGAGLAFVIALLLIPLVGTEFMPKQDRGMLMLNVVLPTGSSLEETDRVVRQAEEILVHDPAVQTVLASVGSQEGEGGGGGFGSRGSHEGMIMAQLLPMAERARSTEEIVEELRARMPAMEGVKIEEMDMSSMSGGTAAPVEIKILGKDFAVLEAIGTDIQRRIADVEGLRDIKSSLEEARPEYHIALNRQEINRLGLSSGQIASTVQTSTLGQVATRFRLAGEETDVRVKFKEQDRRTLRDIQMIPVTTPMKTQIPIIQISSVEKQKGPVAIQREGQVRAVLVTANIIGRDLGSIIRDIKVRLEDLEQHLPEGYFIEFGGQYEDMIETFITLGQALALAILLVYMVMASQFESLVHPFIIMFTIPLALIGVVLAFLVTGQTISLPTFIGFILLTGIVVNNGIVMVDYMNQLRRRGVEAKEAIVQAAATRLRPVLITALTTIFGMLPMAISRQEGGEMRVPMALTVIGGLVFSTALTLFVVPSVYSLVSRVSFKDQA
ncbi:MAG: efflux RND transporter permease subunit [Fidelibacterota bacterium]|nr:MAG: efflux RND transporter permease subunit [Candidatus Neomarinimicrobiota bacterium]